MPIIPPTPPQHEAADAVRDTYTRLARERQASGKEVLARPVYLTGDKETDNYIKASVESSQHLMRKSRAISLMFDYVPGQFEKIFGSGTGKKGTSNVQKG